MAGLLVGLLTTAAHAQQFCWQLNPFPTDQIQLTLANGLPPIGGTEPQVSLFGNWHAVTYKMLGSGMATTHHPPDGRLQLDMVFANLSGAFGGQNTCALRGDLEGTEPYNGTYTFKCSQGFTTSTPPEQLTLTRITCVADPAPLASVQTEGLHTGVMQAGD